VPATPGLSAGGRIRGLTVVAGVPLLAAALRANALKR